MAEPYLPFTSHGGDLNAARIDVAFLNVLTAEATWTPSDSDFFNVACLRGSRFVSFHGPSHILHSIAGKPLLGRCVTSPEIDTMNLSV